MHELHLITTGTVAYAISEHLLELGALAVTLTDAQDNPIFEPEPETLPLWPTIKLSALFEASQHLDEILLQLYSLVDPSSIHDAHAVSVAEQDWVRETQRQFQPICFGERLWIYPSWHEPPEDDAVKILLDPGLAFGTGTHPTTALMLTWLAQNSLNHKNVLDYGCGSGILAIAASKLGAKHVIATDIDPQALLATRDNANRNGIDETQLATYLPADLPADLSVDIVLANILAEPLLQLAERFVNYIPPQGLVVLSGILTQQIAMIEQVYQTWFTLEAVTEQGEWCCMAWQRR